MNKKSLITTKKKTRHLGTQKIINTNNNYLDRKSDQTYTPVVKCRSHKSKMGIRNKPEESNNKTDRLWKIFQIQHDSDKTPNKVGHHERDCFSNSEANKNLSNSCSYHRSNKSRARTKQNTILSKILPTDDPT